MSEAEPTLFDLFARTAAEQPDVVALEVAGRTLSYAALSEHVDALAARLHAARPGARRIGLYASRSLAAYAGYLAVLRLGATIVPLNPDAPAARTELVLAEADLDLVAVDPDETDAPALTTLPRTDLAADTTPGSVPEFLAPAPDSAAYLLFTSGSTGVPKGVPVDHRAVVTFVRHNAARLRVRPGDRFSQNFDLTFDLSVFDLFVCWAGGGTLVAPERDDLLSPVEYVNSRRLTHWFSVPSTIAHAERFGELAPGCMPALRWSLFCGEQLTGHHATSWQAAAPRSTVVNLYGPTELTIACTDHVLPTGGDPGAANGTVPIGLSYPHLESVLVDGSACVDTVGELCVRGPQRFAGYLRPQDNEGRFLDITDRVAVPVPAGRTPAATSWYRTGDRVRRENGVLVHLGRLDDQVKVRGYRVELGEVVGALRGHTAVSDAVVWPYDDPDTGPELVAAYTGAALPAPELAAFLRARLPNYMVPSRYFPVGSFPVGTNGKVDRAALTRSCLGDPQENHFGAGMGTHS
ncbi:MAG: AMP-binding protein [Actinocatenispora sp.]